MWNIIRKHYILSFIIAALLLCVFSIQAFGLGEFSVSIPFTAVIYDPVIKLGVYSDANCVTPFTSAAIGNIAKGTNFVRNVWIKNNSDVVANVVITTDLSPSVGSLWCPSQVLQPGATGQFVLQFSVLSTAASGNINWNVFVTATKQ